MPTTLATTCTPPPTIPMPPALQARPTPSPHGSVFGFARQTTLAPPLHLSLHSISQSQPPITSNIPFPHPEHAPRQQLPQIISERNAPATGYWCRQAGAPPLVVLYSPGPPHSFSPTYHVPSMLPACNPHPGPLPRAAHSLLL